MQNYKMLLQYEGTRYNGWQRQGNTANTIQGIIEELLSSLTGERTELNGSGRTDAGVHAMGQCASFRLEREIDPDEIRDCLNKSLNRDIRILSVEKAEPRFHARLNAKAKTYIYRICTGEKADVFKRHIVYTCPCTLNLEEMKRAAEYLTGEHDFKAFCSNKRIKKSTVRTIYSIDISYNEDILELTFKGNGFLYNMVRILSGTLLEVGLGNIKAEDIPHIIRSMDRKNAGPTLPSSGLMLDKVYY